MSREHGGPESELSASMKPQLAAQLACRLITHTLLWNISRYCIRRAHVEINSRASTMVRSPMTVRADATARPGRSMLGGVYGWRML